MRDTCRNTVGTRCYLALPSISRGSDPCCRELSWRHKGAMLSVATHSRASTNTTVRPAVSAPV